MRIVAGRFGGRRLQAPPGRGTRPTSDRVREALFSTLGPLGGALVLDLFAGSGALGLEALSRGAAHADLVERDARAAAVARANAEALGAGAGGGHGAPDAGAPCARGRTRARRRIRSGLPRPPVPPTRRGWGGSSPGPWPPSWRRPRGS